MRAQYLFFSVAIPSLPSFSWHHAPHIYSPLVFVLAFCKRYRVAPISTNLIMSFLSEKVLGMPRSYWVCVREYIHTHARVVYPGYTSSYIYLYIMCMVWLRFHMHAMHICIVHSRDDRVNTCSHRTTYLLCSWIILAQLSYKISSAKQLRPLTAVLTKLSTFYNK